MHNRIPQQWPWETNARYAGRTPSSLTLKASKFTHSHATHRLWRSSTTYLIAYSCIHAQHSRSKTVIVIMYSSLLITNTVTTVLRSFGRCQNEEGILPWKHVKHENTQHKRRPGFSLQKNSWGSTNLVWSCSVHWTERNERTPTFTPSHCNINDCNKLNEMTSSFLKLREHGCASCDFTSIFYS